MSDISFSALTPQIGSAVVGPNFGQPVSDADSAALERELADRCVVVARGQELAPGQLIAFSRRRMHRTTITGTRPVFDAAA